MEMDDFEKLEKVGEGIIMLQNNDYNHSAAKDKKTGRIVALKQVRLDLPVGEQEGIPPTSLREISLLKECSKNENIVKVLGTPDENVWPGISQFRDFTPVFPKWKPQPLNQYVPTLNSLGVDLLSS
ncbi:15567_t:CDS:2 [Racocetra fulgida]|uniref:cyclin-dependent kinase n=1 Tax=Racocetra fulgida TaxID=60492 RepID=A0A9N9N9L8_9GLOM|nr:15567_t:CDS:2 [Racocetra fulgida]